MAPNIKYNGSECPHPQQMEMSAIIIHSADLNTHRIGPVSYRNIAVVGNNIRKENYILKKYYSVI